MGKITLTRLMLFGFRISILALLSAPVHTEPSDTFEQLVKLSLADLLDLRVSIANREERSLLDAAASTSVFTRSTIRRLGLRNLEELLSLVPGFQVYRETVFSGQIGAPSVRGSTGQGNDVLYMLNGVRLNNYYDNTAQLFYRHIPIEHVARVEIMRGPGSTFYGSNAFSGVINIITDTVDRRISLTLGEHDQRAGFFSWQQSTAGWELSMALRQFEDHGEHYTNVFDQYGVSQNNTTDDPLSGSDLFVQAQQDNWKVVSNYSRRRMDDFFQLIGGIGDHRSYDEQRTALMSVEYQDQWASHTKVSYRLSYQRHIWDIMIMAGAQATDVGAGQFIFVEDNYIGNTYVEHSMYGGGLDIVNHSFTDHALTLGLSYERGSTPITRISGNYNVFSASLPYLGGLETLTNHFIKNEQVQIYGLYLQDEWGVAPDWQFMYGARVDYFNLSDETVVSPRTSLTYRLEERQRLKLVYGHAYKAPSQADLLIDVPGLEGNLALKPSTIQSLDIIYQYQSSKWLMGLTYFINQVKDAIATIDQSEENTTIENVGAQKIAGIEVNGMLEMSDEWTVSLNYSYLTRHEDSFQGDGSFLHPTSLVADDFGSLAITYQQHKWHGYLTATYTDAIDNIPNHASATVVNSGLSYNWDTQLSVSLEGRNITDLDYSTPATGSGLGINSNGMVEREIPNRGRWLNVSIEYRL